MARELEQNLPEAESQAEESFLYRFRELSKDNVRLGLWLLLTVKIMMIGGFTSSYVYLVDGPRNPDYVAPSLVEMAPHINTGLLLVTWVLVWLAAYFIRKEKYGSHRLLMSGAVLFGLAAFGLSLAEYRELLGQQRAAHIGLLGLHIWFMILGLPLLVTAASRSWRHATGYLTRFTGYTNTFWAFVFAYAIWLLLIVD